MLNRHVKENAGAVGASHRSAQPHSQPSASSLLELRAAAFSTCLEAALFGGAGARVKKTDGSENSSSNAGEDAESEAWLDALDDAAAPFSTTSSGAANQVPDTAASYRSSSAADGLKRMRRQIFTWRRDLGFSVGVTCVTILRYVTDVLPRLPLSVQTRILDTHDLPLALVPLIENPPWVMRRTGARDASSKPSPSPAAAAAAAAVWLKYVNHEWTVVPPRDLLKLTPTEGQAWLALYNLLCEPEIRKRYSLHSHRKNTLLRVRKYLNEVSEGNW